MSFLSAELEPVPANGEGGRIFETPMGGDDPCRVLASDGSSWAAKVYEWDDGYRFHDIEGPAARPASNSIIDKTLKKLGKQE